MHHDIDIAELMTLSAADQANALIDAASEDASLSLLSALLEAGVPPDVAGEDGETALFRAAGNGNVKTCYRLLRAGADPDLVALDGLTPKKVASSRVKALFKKTSTGGWPTPRDLVDDAKVVKIAGAAIRGLIEGAEELEGHTVYVVAVDEEDLKVNSLEAFAEAMSEEEMDADEKGEARLDPTRFALSVPFSTKRFAGELKTAALNEKRAHDDRTKEDLVAALIAENRALFAGKVALSTDFTAIASPRDS